MSEMTERQAKAWPGVIASLNRAIGADWIPESGYNWEFLWADEIRPGRGHDLNAIFNDGEYFAQVRINVYGGTTTSVATLDWIHTPDEECDCASCEAERAEPEEGTS